LIPEELMQQVRQLELRMRRSVSEVFAGEYSSAFRGQGMEFSEVREYQPGDEIRSIDWNVTARTGSAYVKRFVEERELTIMLAVDRSASARFGSVNRIKAAAAAELCAVLAFAAVKGGDKVGLLSFADEVETFIPAKKGINHVLRIVRELLDDSPSDAQRSQHRGGTNMIAVLERMATVLKRRSVIVLVSDFLLDDVKEGALPEDVRRALAWVARKHDVIAARVTDPRERELPAAGLIEVEDAETGARVLVDTTSARVRRDFAQRMVRREMELTRQLRAMKIDDVLVQTNEPCVHALIELFRRREKRR